MRLVKLTRSDNGATVYLNPEYVVMLTSRGSDTAIRTTAVEEDGGHVIIVEGTAAEIRELLTDPD